MYAATANNEWRCRMSGLRSIIISHVRPIWSSLKNGTDCNRFALLSVACDVTYGTRLRRAAAPSNALLIISVYARVCIHLHERSWRAYVHLFVVRSTPHVIYRDIINLLEIVDTPARGTPAPGSECVTTRWQLQSDFLYRRTKSTFHSRSVCVCVCRDSGVSSHPYFPTQCNKFDILCLLSATYI